MEMKKAILFFFILCCVGVAFLYIKESRNFFISYQLHKMSDDDRKCLDLFFRSCFSSDPVAYTLFGDKPISITGYYVPRKKMNHTNEVLDSLLSRCDPDQLKNLCNLHNMRQYQGWLVWKKYRHLFPIKNYAVIESKNLVDNDYMLILFINKKAFLETVSTYLNDFKNVLGNKITPELLLEQVLKSDNVFGDILKNHQGLIGTLFGYGRHNAWLFHHREEILFAYGRKSPLFNKRSYVLKKLPKSSSQDEWDILNNTLQPFDDREIPFNSLCMSLPQFVADHSSKETQQLKRKYEKQYRQIVHHYQKGDFLKLTLEKLTAE